MTMHHSQNITCPGCGLRQGFDVYPSVNVTLNPVLKDRLLSRRLTAFKCPSCGHEADVNYDLLYHDMHKMLMIYLLQGGEEPPPLSAVVGGSGGVGALLSEAGTFRLVRSLNELVEKVRIFDEGLDDRLIETVKRFMEAQMAPDLRASYDSVFFDGFTTEPSGEKRMKFALVGGKGQASFSVSQEHHEMYCSKLSSLIPDRDAERGRWLRVDMLYVAELLQKENGHSRAGEPASASAALPSPPKRKPWWRFWGS